jgi:hypothetical protein
MENIKVGYYSKPFDSGYKEVSLNAILKSFGNGHFQSVVDPARQLYRDNKYEEYTLYKNKLPAITFSGLFNPKRTMANIYQYSSLVILDIDKAGDNLSVFKNQLSADPYVIAVWLSPSGDGLKFIVASDASKEKHKDVYTAAAQYFRAKYDMDIDRSGSDVSRLCFVSFDPDIRINSQYVLFNDYCIEEDKKSEIGQKTKKKEYLNINSGISNEALSKQTFKKIFHYLSKRNISITDTYENWVRVAFAIRNTFSYSLGYEYFLELCRLDGGNHDESASEYLINSCYNKGTTQSSFATIIYLCTQKGFDVDFNKKMNGKKKAKKE